MATSHGSSSASLSRTYPPASTVTSISSYLREPSAPPMRYAPSNPQGKQSSTTKSEWKKIHRIVDWDRFNNRDFPKTHQNLALLQPKPKPPPKNTTPIPAMHMPKPYRIIVDEKHVETYLIMTVVAKVNTVLEVISTAPSSSPKSPPPFPAWKLLQEFGVISGCNISNSIVTPQGSNMTSRGSADHHAVVYTEPITTTVSRPEPFAVGEVKREVVWWSEMRGDPDHVVKYRGVLAQLDLYMRNADVKYGWIMTDKEFVAVNRPGPNGLLKVSRAYPIFFEKESHNPAEICAEEALVDLLLWATIKYDDLDDLKAKVVKDKEYLDAEALETYDPAESTSDENDEKSAKGSKGKQSFALPTKKTRTNSQISPTISIAERVKRAKKDKDNEIAEESS